MKPSAVARAPNSQLLGRPLRATTRGPEGSSPRGGRQPGPVVAAAASGRPPSRGGRVQAQVAEPLAKQKCSPCEPREPLEFMGFCTVS